MSQRDIEILNELIHESAKTPLITQYDRKHATLKEPQSPDSVVMISGIPDETIIIKADSFCGQEGFFAGSKGECKNADYIIFSVRDQRKVVVFIEMKRTKGSKSEIEKKFEAARCLVQYCQKLGASFWEQQDFLSGFENRFISIGHTRIAKHKTRIERNPSGHDEPARMMKIDWPGRLQFNKIVGR